MSRLLTLNWQIYEMLTADSVPRFKQIQAQTKLPTGREPTFTDVRFRPRLCENVVSSRLERLVVAWIEYFVKPVLRGI